MEDSGVSSMTSWNKLITVKGTKIYYDGEEATGSVTEGEKQFAIVNTKCVIWPDKKYLDLTNNTIKDLAASASVSGATFTTNTMTVSGLDLTAYFSVGDCVQISGCTDVTANNKSIVIQNLTQAVMTVSDDAFIATTESGTINIERKIPDLDYICESENRLWGCSNADRTIYASALGDPTNFYTYEGVSTDSYAVAVGSQGDFTGCCKLSSSVLFWKETILHKMLGSYPAEYSLHTYNIEGLRAGCHKSLQVINDVLFYVGLHGVFAFSGGTPSMISLNFGSKELTDAVGGNDGDTYFLCAKDGEESHLYLYETTHNIWVLEDALNTLCADGYVPVTTRKAYLQSGRPITTGLRSIPAGMPETVKIRVAYPDGKSGSDERAYLELADTYSPDNLAVYKAGTHYGWKGAWICEADSAESGHYLTRPDGSLYAADAVRFAGDGSLLLAEAEQLYRLDPETGKELPVQEGEPEYFLTLDFPVEYIWHGEAVPGKAHDVGRFWITDGFRDRLFVLGRNGFSVFSADPVKLLYTICDEHTAEAELSPFYSSYWIGFCPVATPAGERYVIVGSKYVYDAETGALLYEIEDYGQNLGGRIMQSTAEGYVPIQVYDVLYIWDLTMRQPVGFIPGAYYRYTVCGPYDEETNRCSASVIVTDSDELYDLSTSTVDGMIWVLKDMAVPVPKDLEGKIALARELLDGRKLTEAERLKYKLSGK